MKRSIVLMLVVICGIIVASSLLFLVRSNKAVNEPLSENSASSENSFMSSPNLLLINNVREVNVSLYNANELSDMLEEIGYFEPLALADRNALQDKITGNSIEIVIEKVEENSILLQTAHTVQRYPGGAILMAVDTRVEPNGKSIISIGLGEEILSSPVRLETIITSAFWQSIYVSLKYTSGDTQLGLNTIEREDFMKTMMANFGKIIKVTPL